VLIAGIRESTEVKRTGPAGLWALHQIDVDHDGVGAVSAEQAEVGGRRQWSPRTSDSGLTGTPKGYNNVLQ
jgi:hypothetical protein